MTPASLKAWRERLYGTGYGTRSVETACKALGLSRRAYDAYESGEHRIPRYIELACMALYYQSEGIDPEDFLETNAVDVNKYESEIYDIIRRSSHYFKRLR